MEDSALERMWCFQYIQYVSITAKGLTRKTWIKDTQGQLVCVCLWLQYKIWISHDLNAFAASHSVTECLLPPSVTHYHVLS